MWYNYIGVKVNSLRSCGATKEHLECAVMKEDVWLGLGRLVLVPRHRLCPNLGEHFISYL